MDSVRLNCVMKPHVGEKWLLKRTRKGLVVLDEDENVAISIPAEEARLHVRIPIMVRFVHSLGFTGYRWHLTIEDEKENEVRFELRGKAIKKIRALIEDCAEAVPEATAAAYRKQAIRYLGGGIVGFTLGLAITIGSFLLADNDTFLVMTGLLVLGPIAFVRGIYLAIVASQYNRMAERDD